MAKSKGKGKGSAWEREFCTLLSEWWTEGERSDVFWRTSNSGGRATSRSRKGKVTKNAHGDVCATDPVGQPLMDAICFELKRGYSKHTFADLLDKPAGAAEQVYEKWVFQAIRSHRESGALTWALVVKRDRREPVVFFDDSRLAEDGMCEEELSEPFMRFVLLLKSGGKNTYVSGVGTTLVRFLEYVNPREVAHIMKG